VAEDAPISTKPYFSRAGLNESKYEISDPASFGRPFNPPPLVAVAKYSVNGVAVELTEVVKRRESKAPYGDATREVRAVPRVALTVVTHGSGRAASPRRRRRWTCRWPSSTTRRRRRRDRSRSPLPAGWTSTPAQHPFTFQRAGERATYQFKINAAAIDAKPYEVVAVATAEGRSTAKATS
jgi:hypothetical protein